MTCEQKQAKLEVLEEAITRICPICKEQAQSGMKMGLGGSRERLRHRLAGDEIVECKAGPLHMMILEIREQGTDQECT